MSREALSPSAGLTPVTNEREARRREGDTTPSGDEFASCDSRRKGRRQYVAGDARVARVAPQRFARFQFGTEFSSAGS
jgi:hypothetical protein